MKRLEMIHQKNRDNYHCFMLKVDWIMLMSIISTVCTFFVRAKQEKAFGIDIKGTKKLLVNSCRPMRSALIHTVFFNVEKLLGIIKITVATMPIQSHWYFRAVSITLKTAFNCRAARLQFKTHCYIFNSFRMLSIKKFCEQDILFVQSFDFGGIFRFWADSQVLFYYFVDFS
jgi:hypothetical protein